MLCESQPPARIKEEGEVRARQVGCDRTEARERLVGILEPAAVDGERDRERPRIENVVRETMSSSKLEGLRDVAFSRHEVAAVSRDQGAQLNERYGAGEVTDPARRTKCALD